MRNCVSHSFTKGIYPYLIKSRALQAPSSWYGIISGRTLCSNESRGNFSCATGDCESNKIEWPGSYGWSTVTYIYFRIDYSGTNSYFISLEYGYNLPVMVVPSHSSPTCFSSGCMVGLNKTCPNKLMIYDGIIPIACSSACKESKSKRQKREKREECRISSEFVKADLEGQTDPDRADILWEASSVSRLKVHRRDLDFNGWNLCCLGFSEAGRHSSSAVLS
ncbi:unnamed protein product [Brassica oleracea var. botrytis]|uniref:Uncharacterized protein n=2 Tax=Brassica oleracea TaxID=3712 RepID=A0A0D3DMN1_BRAOL|nr:unnamed protein product [Brassica oleracea]